MTNLMLFVAFGEKKKKKKQEKSTHHPAQAAHGELAGTTEQSSLGDPPE